MVHLYPHITISESFELDEVIHFVENIGEYVAPLIANKDQFPLQRVSFQLTKWYQPPNSKSEYLCIGVGVNLDDCNDFFLRVEEGYYSDTDNCVRESDAFVDIKSDVESIQMAIDDIKNGSIPLWNRDDNIDLENYRYVKDE